jgi:zinc protease
MHTPVTKLTLPNGLLVLLKEIHTSPIISHWIWYRVGSRDEKTGQTGSSHWVEHMQFKGTPLFPASLLDKLISREGGNWNAFTYLDWTAYYETMPSEKIDLALQLEADRMVNSIFDLKEFESERTVILSERQGHENEPVFRLREEVHAAAFRVHPYHHEIIGDTPDLQSLQLEDLHRHYRTYYVPNNAVLSIAGDFETGAMLDRIRELYEPVGAGSPPPRLVRPEPEQRGERRVQVEGPGDTTFVQLAYHSPSASHPDFFAFMVMDSLLSGPSGLNLFGGGISNKTSRLYRALVESELAISVHGGFNATIDPHLYQIMMTVNPKHIAAEAVSAVDQEIRRLQEELPSLGELERAVKQARALFAYGSESISNQAFWLGFSEMFATYEWFESYLDRLAEVTPADVQRVTQKFLRPQNRVVGVYFPEGYQGEAPE